MRGRIVTVDPREDGVSLFLVERREKRSVVGVAISQDRRNENGKSPTCRFSKGAIRVNDPFFFFFLSLLLPFFPFFPRAREDCTIHAIPVGGEIYRGGYPANGLMDSPFIRDLDYQFARRPRDFYGRLRVPFNCFIRSSFGSYDPIYVSRLMNLKYDCMHTRRKDLLKDLDRWLRSWSWCF